MECHWNCSACTFQNLPEKLVCDMCRTERGWKEPERPVEGEKIFENEKTWSVEKHPYAIREVKIIDQYENDVLKGFVKKHVTCSAICGYCCTGVASFIAAYNGSPETLVEKALLSGEEGLCKHIEGSMMFIQTDRQRYIDRNRDAFSSPKEIEEYLKAWVANYEISRFVEKCVEKSSRIVFLRTNQNHELEEATHEEKELIVAEESPFGAQPFMLEFFSPRSLVTCSREVFRKECRRRGHPPTDIIWILDLKGHYNTAISYETNVIILDTYAANHCGNPAAKTCFDLVFGDSE